MKNQLEKEYTMKLYDRPFDLIKSGKKTIEVRCYDEKRQQLKTGDIIIFLRYNNPQDIIRARIVELIRFQNFKDLYGALPLKLCGLEGLSVEDAIAAVDKIYSKDKQEKYNALAIVIEKL